MKTSLNSTAHVAPPAAIERTRRAKIVATLGPACSTPEVFRQLVRAGLDVARLNFSHGSHAQKAELIRMVRTVAKEEGKPICILADLQGPKIRTGKLKGHKPVQLIAGKRLTITPREIEGTAAIVGTTFKTLAENLEPGSRILLSDGLIELRVEQVKGLDVVCAIVNGGMLGENKGINLPGIAVNVPSLTEKDEEDLIFAIGQGVDTLAVSFVRTADDIRHVKNRLAALKSDAWIIAKLEKPQAIEHLDSILEITDAIMVARGDLGVEVPPEKVPAIQKHIIRRAAEYRKPVITATQMLESMIENPRPTRAEASDVANAVLDGTDAVMLSAETSVGRYPVEAVKTMARIICAVEDETLTQGLPPLMNKPRTKGGAVARAAAELGDYLSAKYLVAFTQSGDTARRLSRYRSPIKIVAFTPEPIVRNQLALNWGVETLIGPTVDHTDDMVRQVDAALIEHGRCQVGDVIIITAGSPPGIPGGTNAVRVHRVGDAVAGVAPAYRD